MEKIIKLFFNTTDSIKIKENFKEYTIETIGSDVIIPESSKLKDYLREISRRDIIVIDVRIDEGDIVVYNSDDQDTIEVFLEKVNDEKELFFEKNSIVHLKVTIIKKFYKDNKISIYNFSKFTEYLTTLTFKGLLYCFKNAINGKDYIIFELKEEVEHEFNTRTFYFGNSDCNVKRDSFDRNKILDKRDQISNFSDASQYNLIPDDFYLVNRSNNQDFNNIMDKLTTIFAIIFICDLTKIKDDNNILYSIYGYKIIKNEINYSKKYMFEENQHYKIYYWLYKEGNLSDKSGLVRNIISLHVKDNNITMLEAGTLDAIKSAYKIYSKENIQQYLDAKSKLTDKIFDISRKSCKIADDFVERFKKNILVMVTFVSSVIVMNSIYAGKSGDIFNKDITYISMCIIMGSLIWLIISWIETGVDHSRFECEYGKLKKSYKDVLNEQDIERIFNYDKDFKEDNIYINNKVKLYSALWLTFISIFLFLICKIGNLE